MSEPKGTGDSKFSIEGLQIYLEAKIDAIIQLQSERAKHADDKFKFLDAATEKALAAVEKQTNAAFAANKEAILKAEEAQRAYNERSNEFRGQLDDQAKRLMAREEVLSKFQSYDEKFESFRLHFEERADDNKREIIKLRELQMASAGREIQRSETRQSAQWGVGQVIAIVFGIIGSAGIVIAVLQALLKSKP